MKYAQRLRFAADSGATKEVLNVMTRTCVDGP
jgi:hypothetical protein